MFMKKFILFLLVAVAASCGLKEIGGVPDESNGDVWIPPGVDVDSLAKDESVFYVVAMEYLYGYDWLSDMEKGTVKCSLAVYADGGLIMKLPVGEKYEVSSDPETHRIVNGHLYTEYISDNETVIKRDGRGFIRYPGREVICDLVEHEGKVYTLGHNIDGEGFTCRKNGEIIFERAEGSSFGRLQYCNDSLCFAFIEPIESEKETLERYYHVINGETVQTAVREDIRKVWDIAFHKGGICYVASLVGIPYPVLFTDSGLKALDMPQSSELLSCRIIDNDEALYVEGQVEQRGEDIISCLWDSGGIVHAFPYSTAVSSVCMDVDGICCILNPSSSDTEGEIYKCGESYFMPEGYVSIGPRTCAVVNGILHAGLSSLSGAPPILWKDDELTQLKINGYITVVSVNGK